MDILFNFNYMTSFNLFLLFISQFYVKLNEPYIKLMETRKSFFDGIIS